MNVPYCLWRMNCLIVFFVTCVYLFDFGLSHYSLIDYFNCFIFNLVDLYQTKDEHIIVFICCTVRSVQDGRYLYTLCDVQPGYIQCVVCSTMNNGRLAIVTGGKELKTWLPAGNDCPLWVNCVCMLAYSSISTSIADSAVVTVK